MEEREIEKRLGYGGSKRVPTVKPGYKKAELSQKKQKSNDE
jgi:hypothetical protein